MLLEVVPDGKTIENSLGKTSGIIAVKISK